MSPREKCGLAALIYVVKSNIAHGNKTRFGPDFAKAERDRQVCMAGIPALHEILNSIFDHPWQKLIAYGTLRPNEPNHEVLAPIRNQTWEDCEITGSLTDTDGLKEFKWHVSTERHVAKLLSSPELPSHWQMLDDFEGDGYVRTFATALVNGTLRVAMVYQKR